MSENKNITNVKNEIINSGKISLKALGLFLFLKSKDKSFVFSNLNIEKAVKEGRESIRSAMQELEELKLIERKKSKNKLGRFEFSFSFLDEDSVEEVEVVEVAEIVSEKVAKLPIKKPQKEVLKQEEIFEPPTEKAKNDDGGLYAKMIDIYFDWFKSYSGVKPKFTAIDGLAMKRIIIYFKMLNKENKGEGEDEFTEVTNMFSFIFAKWDLVEPFHQKQTKLNQIESNLQNIINDIKNGHKRKSNTKDKSESARQSGIKATFSVIDEMYKRK